MTTRIAHLPRPTAEEIAALPAFTGLPLARIALLTSPAQFSAASRALRESKVVGFDTESKPTFTRDAVRDGPHVAQFATREAAYVVQLRAAGAELFLRAVLEADDIVKVGFGLSSDRALLQANFGITLAAAIDLSREVRRLGYKHDVGVKAAVAVVLHRRMQKSKSVTTSNWGREALQPAQLLYAANDAFAALAVYDGLVARSSAREPMEPMAPMAPREREAPDPS